MGQGAPPPDAPDPTAAASEQQWLSDFRQLLDNARHRFGDVAWRDPRSGKEVYAHKCIVYARATGIFQQRYLGVPHSLSQSDLSLYGQSTTSLRAFTPSSGVHRESLTPTVSSVGQSVLRSSSVAYGSSEDESGRADAVQHLTLGDTDIDVFEAALEYFYTASSEAAAFVVALEGFQDETTEDEPSLQGVARLRQDLLYCWRSKLFADVSIVLDGVAGEPFTAHRAILASRSPYFRSLLLGDYRDAAADVFTLPSPPFTPASTTFVLGYLYSGTLDFSPRKFDLATSCEIWRCAAFLSLSTLQSAIETKIVAQLNVARAARVLAFAHAPDVNSTTLIEAATPIVIEHLGTAWTATPHVGCLEYDVQRALVKQVCDQLEPHRVAHTANQVARGRRQLECESAPWAQHVRGMLDGIEKALVDALSLSLPQVVRSRGFIDLTEGVGFNNDVLEWVLTLVVKGLREGKAPVTYQTLVGAVLLREKGIMADARVLVEDTRAGILGYIKRRWTSIRVAGGFDDLEPWCLKELADVLNLKTTDLISDGPKLQPIQAKGRQPPQHLVDGVPSSVGRPLRTTTAPRPIATRSSAPVTETRASRAPISTRSSSTSLAASRPSAPRVPSATSNPSSRRATSSAVTPRPQPALPRAAETGPSPRLVNGVGVGRLPTTQAAPSPGSAVRPNCTNGGTNSNRPASLRSVAPATPRTRAPSTPEAFPRRASSPAPSVASRRSVSTVASARSTTAASRPPTVRRTAMSIASTSTPVVPRRTVTASTPVVPRRMVTSSTPVVPRRTATSSTSSPSALVVNGVPPRRQPSSPSLQSVTPATRTTGAASPSMRRPASAITLASRRTGATGIGSRTNGLSPPTGPATIASTAGPSTGPKALRSPLAPTPAVGSSRPPTTFKHAPSATGVPHTTPELPGTSLLAGIPCIVTVQGGGDGPGKVLRIKAQVRYIGELLDSAGQWVGVEVLESAIPPEAEELGWGDGSRAGVSYFELSPPLPSPSLESTPLSRAASPALRPPSRRGVRRSTSPNGQPADGPRKAIFVRPDQIVYIL